MHYQHYFSTNDGQFRTQDLMDKIKDIAGLKERMKLFFIQVGFKTTVMICVFPLF